MPSPKRWFPVSHDFLDDPETYELRRTFGDRAVFMWLRMLSWADRNEGTLKGDRAYIALTLGRDHDPIHSTSSRDRGLKVLQWMEDRGWIEQRSSLICIANYAKYHRTREPNQIPQGSLIDSPPNLPDLPSEPNLPKKEEIKEKKDHVASRLQGAKKAAENGEAWEVVDENGFAAYWQLHPGPKGPKQDALKAHLAVKSPPEALEALAAQVRFKAACDRRGAFFPEFQHLHRWFKKRRWEDELPALPLPQAEELWLEAQQEKQERESGGNER